MWIYCIKETVANNVNTSSQTLCSIVKKKIKKKITAVEKNMWKILLKSRLRALALPEMSWTFCPVQSVKFRDSF